jgi:pilus assembly protein FimV
VSYQRKNYFKVRLSALAVASCLGAVPMLAQAAGLGRITVLSSLGQPLRAEIEVSATKDELNNMVARLAAPDAFKAAGMDYPTILASVQLALDKRPNGQTIVKVTSDRAVSDPFIDLLVELNWSAGRLVREYTFLIDPPAVSKDVATNPPVAKPVEVAPKVEPKPVETAPEPVAEKPAETPAEPEKAPEAAAEKPVVAEKVVASEKAAPAKSVEPAGVRAVKRGDYLARIAGEVKPEGVTLDQMLVGLFRANPDAFQGKNMNRLKTGKILSIPAADQLAVTPAAEARKLVVAQAADWNAYRRKLAATAVQEKPAAEDTQQETAGKITAKVQDKAPAPTEGKDKVTVSKTETAAVGPAGKGKAAEEDKIAREKALKESAERAAQLEKNVAELQKLNELKNKSLAEAQKKAAPAAAAPAAKPVEPAKVEPAKPVEAAKPAAAKPTEAVKPAEAAKPAVAAQAQPAKPVEPAKPAEAAKPTEVAKPAAKPSDNVPVPAKPKPKVPPPPPPEPEEDLLANPAVWGGVLALLGGIGGLLFYRRRKAKAAAPSGESIAVVSSLVEPSLGANSVFRATGGQSVDTSNATPAVTDFSQTGPGTIDTDEVDPVAEAEVYMAYGRDAQAEEILLEALQKDSKRLAIHLKLLEIYAQRKSVKQFETLATELFAQTGGSGAEWEKAAAMGAKLDPANPLYHGTTAGMAEPAGGGFDPGATMVVSSPLADASKSTVVMPGAFAQMAEPATADAGAGGLSFDLDIGGAGSFAATPAAPAPAAEPMDLGGLAMDISFDLPGASTPAPARAPEVAHQEASPGGLDFDLGFGATNFAPPEEAVDLGSANSVGLDFDVKLTDSTFSPAPANKPDMSAINLDLGAGDADFGQTLFVTPGLAAEMGDMSFSSGNGADQGGLAPGESQEVATKLDLAKAYEEMGDAEGARELLQEVLREGSSGQKDAAKTILARLG